MLRLKGGVWPWQGRVEVFKDGKWGTVCDVRFDLHDGNIVCRELGYGSVETIFPRGRQGQALGPIHLSNCQLATRNIHTQPSENKSLLVPFRCTGTEEHLIDCPCTTGREVERQCKHTGDVGVLCHVPNSTSTDEVYSYSKVYSDKHELKTHRWWSLSTGTQMSELRGYFTVMLKFPCPR